MRTLCFGTLISVVHRLVCYNPELFSRSLIGLDKKNAEKHTNGEPRHQSQKYIFTRLCERMMNKNKSLCNRTQDRAARKKHHRSLSQTHNSNRNSSIIIYTIIPSHPIPAPIPSRNLRPACPPSTNPSSAKRSVYRPIKI